MISVIILKVNVCRLLNKDLLMPNISNFIIISRYSELMTRNRAYLMAFATWLISIIFICLAFHTRALICRYNCERLTTDNSRYGSLMYLFFTFFVSAFPAFSSFVVALYLLRIVTIHRKQIAEGYFHLFFMYFNKNY